MLTSILITLIFLELCIILLLIFFKPNAILLPPRSESTPEKVGQYYNQTTDKFIEVYGEIIQAFRTRNVNDYLDYTLINARIKSGMKLLDAGCGVAGPACYFAKKIPHLHIDACTISEIQLQIAQEKIESENVQKSIFLKCADYHDIHNLYPTASFDRVYFLESFGHSNNKSLLIQSVWEVLKPGGMIYIKDLFRREVEDEWQQLHINHICEQINEAYQYQIADLNTIVSLLRKKGYLIHYIKIPELVRSTFENLTISNDFQNLFDIGKIKTWDDYVFPIDFFEILAEKPAFNHEEDIHLYFMNRNYESTSNHQ